MKTLIVHPEDSSTSFLDIVYNPIKNKTVITKDVEEYELMDLIDSHDRIMMMGHGSPSGLFSVGQFPNDYGFVIHDKFVPILKQKPECFYLWCNADKFVEEHELSGFYSGMFISEVYEANFCNVKATQGMVDESNMTFCHILARHINEKMEQMHENVKLKYSNFTATNSVVSYNSKRLYYRLEKNAELV